MNWTPGQSIAQGVMQINQEHREQYGNACKAEIIKATVRYITSIKTRGDRLTALERVPKSMREDVKCEVLKWWNKNKI